ncbi:pyridoxal-phosphate-dependent aminotransferase family protein [Thermoproteus tenax]|uniref:Aminotransferase n=1 Tax=Thermoproteus tenax (strain ATCC 35583 / DSM 2078 / JCM 9277 / NBRC 100435 / Kra 1) TaxID=768679 RepID=G4RMM8_THETK|nr:alanine--glyoxylate aminotransferase family protein [Thermoproteus tenax]CCC82704.1 putative aminotransferase [Thermoproteus tenax Kra 1]
MKYLTPGPIQLPDFVIKAMYRQPAFHRSEEFKQSLKSVLDRISKVYSGTPVIMPGTGTLAVDTMVYNYVNPGDRVLSIVFGEFGKRLTASLRSRGAEVYEWEVQRPPEPEEVDDKIRKMGEVKAVALVHNETSMGIAYKQLAKVADVVKSHGALLLVDSVSGMPAEPLPPGIDVVATASHKAFMAPPGAAILFLNAEPAARSGVPPAMDLKGYLKVPSTLDTPYTPPISVIYALEASLEYILGLGLERYVEMHRERMDLLYGSVKLKPVPEPRFRSNTVAAFFVNDVKSALKSLRDAGYVASAGMGPYKDKVVRVGVMGDVTREDILKVAEVLNNVA